MSVAAEEDEDNVEMVVVDFLDLLGEDCPSAVEEQLYVPHHWIIFVQLHCFVEAVDREILVQGAVFGLINHFVPKMFVYELDRIIFMDEGLSFIIEILEQGSYYPLSPRLQTRPQFVLEMHLHAVAEVASDVQLDLQRGRYAGEGAGTALALVVKFGPNEAALGAVVRVFALFAEFEDGVELAAIDALRQKASNIAIDGYVVNLQIVGGVLSIVIEHDLQIVIKGTISLVYSQLFSFEATQHQGLRLELGAGAGYGVEQGQIVRFQSVAGKGRFIVL